MGWGCSIPARDGGRTQPAFPGCARGDSSLPKGAAVCPSPALPFSLPTAPGIAWAPFPERFVGADGSEQEAPVQPWGEAELGEGWGHTRAPVGPPCPPTRAEPTLPCS